MSPPSNLAATPPRHRWEEVDDWDDLLGLPEDDEVARFEELSEQEELCLAAAVGEWLLTRLRPYASTAELSRAFLDALWARAAQGTDVDLQRRANAGRGAVDGALRLMRELSAEAGTLAYAMPGLVRLARHVLPAAHLADFDAWLEQGIEQPPAPPREVALAPDNPFRFWQPDRSPASLHGEYLRFLDGDGDPRRGLPSLLGSLFPLTHPAGRCRVDLLGTRVEPLRTCSTALRVEVAARLVDQGTVVDQATTTLDACLEPRGATLAEATAYAGHVVRRYCEETRDLVESVADPLRTDLRAGWLTWW